MLSDLRYAARSLKRSPGFSAVAIVTLALGIGVNTTVFSIVEALILRPLPIVDPGRVVMVESNRYPQLSIPDYLDVQRQNSTFSGLTAYRATTMAVDTGGGAQHLYGYLVTGNYFDLLGITPAIGRFFTAQEDGTRDAAPFAVLSYESWQRRFGGNPGIAGDTLRINGLAYTILGVLPRSFHGTEVFLRPEIWVPMSMQAQVEGGSWLDSRVSANSLVAGRLKPGVTAAQAVDDLSAIARSIAAAHPRTHEGFQFSLSAPGLFGSMLRAPASAFMAGVLALAGLVLFAACVNLASLLTSRMVDRGREMAIRLSLGASRLRIARHVLAETGLLAVLGGAAGLMLAAGGLRLLSAWQLPFPIPVQFAVMPDARVWAFAAAVTCAVAAFASLAPARRGWRTEPARLTGATTVAFVVRRWGVRDVLLGIQVALCCLLVMCSLVAVRGLLRAFSTPIGIEPAGLSVVGFDLAMAGYDGRSGTALRRRLLDEVGGIPGITSVAMASALPLTPDTNNSSVFADDGSELRPANERIAAVYRVSPGYFGVAGTRLLAGREVTDADRITTPRVAVVNAEFARRVMRTGEPVGKRFRYGPDGAPIEVVGMVETGKYYALNEDPRPTIFLPIYQSYISGTMILARSSISEAATAAVIGQTVQKLDARLPLYLQQGASSAIALTFLPSQVAVVALGIFGVLAVVLALVGVYGLAAYSVSARARELGIRLAIGASRRQILQTVFGRTGLLLGGGSIVGIAAGTAAQRVLGAVVYQASSRDPLLVTAVALAMVFVGLGATWMPARRALGIDPAATLRG